MSQNKHPSHRNSQPGRESPGTVAKQLKEIFRQYDYSFKDTEIELMARFYVILMEANAKYNFTRIHRLEDAAVKHFIDCAIVTKYVDLPSPLLDMGTGPGFPGIPLKIICPDVRIILAEGVQNRVNFLKEAREKLNLKNLDVIGRNVDPKFMYPVQGVITRAVELMAATLANVKNCVQSGGKVIFMKTPEVDDELKEALEKMGAFFELTQDVTYDLPKTSHHRRLLVFAKKKPIPPAS